MVKQLVKKTIFLLFGILLLSCNFGNNSNDNKVNALNDQSNYIDYVAPASDMTNHTSQFSMFSSTKSQSLIVKLSNNAPKRMKLKLVFDDELESRIVKSNLTIEYNEKNNSYIVSISLFQQVSFQTQINFELNNIKQKLVAKIDFEEGVTISIRQIMNSKIPPVVLTEQTLEVSVSKVGTIPVIVNLYGYGVQIKTKRCVFTRNVQEVCEVKYYIDQVSSTPAISATSSAVGIVTYSPLLCNDLGIGVNFNSPILLLDGSKIESHLDIDYCLSSKSTNMSIRFPENGTGIKVDPEVKPVSGDQDIVYNTYNLNSITVDPNLSNNQYHLATHILLKKGDDQDVEYTTEVARLINIAKKTMIITTSDSTPINKVIVIPSGHLFNLKIQLYKILRDTMIFTDVSSDDLSPSDLEQVVPKQLNYKYDNGSNKIVNLPINTLAIPSNITRNVVIKLKINADVSEFGDERKIYYPIDEYEDAVTIVIVPRDIGGDV